MTYMTTITEAKEMIESVIKSGNTSINCYLHSSPGIGKSAIISQIADALDYELVDIRLASIEATDLGGLPFVLDGEQVFSTPEWFPTDPDSKGILFLDELSNATINTQQAAYRLVLDRTISNMKKLPSRWVVIAAGNLQSDKTGVKGIVPALANRFALHLHIEPNLSDFMHYAMKAKINTQIMGFLNFKPDYLHKFTPGDVAFPTPRGWESASKLINCNFKPGQVMAALAGCVGEGTAAEFMSFVKYYDKLPNFTLVMEGKEEYTLPDNDLGLIAAMTSSIISLMHENHKYPNKIKNLNKLMMQLPDESLILIYKIIAGTTDADLIINVTENTIESYNKVATFIS